MLHKGGRRVGGDDLTAHAAWETDPCTVDMGATRGEDSQGLRMVANLYTDLGEHGIGGVLDGAQRFLAEDLEGCHREGEIGDALDDSCRPHGSAVGSASRTSADGWISGALCHERSLSGRPRRRPGRGVPADLESGRVITAAR